MNAAGALDVTPGASTLGSGPVEDEAEDPEAGALGVSGGSGSGGF